jgi:eukaryotic-like serine/threonine-protein kinase
MTEMTGQRIAHYEILEKLGEGGMGVVYKAHDTKLGRTVALKVLPSDRISSPEARERFEREAKVVASLNHPHVCTLHDFISENGTDVLVMEYVEGKPLKGPLPLERALEVGAQIADALDHAHRHGVVHRDIKPGNVMVTKSGVKLLDFGLAKATGSDPDYDVTRTAGITQEGTILGTFHYMSPEQWEGKEADARSDIFSFGALLYELLTGRRAFEGKSQASLVAAIMEKDPPPVSSVEPVSPPALDRVVQKCLEKDPDNRWQSAADLRDELRWISSNRVQRATGTSSSRRPILGLTSAVAALVVVVGWLLTVRSDSSDVQRTVRFAVAKDSDIKRPAISPDGRHVVYIRGEGERSVLWFQSLDQEQPRPLAVTNGVRSAFWAPDSQHIGFTTASELKRIPLAGEPAATLASWVAHEFPISGSWSPDGKTIAINHVLRTGQFPIYEVPARGGELRLLVGSESTNTRYPSYVLVQGKPMLLFGEGSETSASINLFDPDTQQKTVLGQGYRPVYSPSGHILYETSASTGRLWGLPFSAEKGVTTGKPFPIAENAQWHSVSTNGTLVYLDASPDQYQLYWADDAGALLEPIGQPQQGIQYPTISRDEKWVLASAVELENRDIWLHDTSGAMKQRITVDPDVQRVPIWGPGEDRITFTWRMPGAQGHDIYAGPFSGLGEAELLVSETSRDYPCDWTADGKTLLHQRRYPQTGRDLWLLHMADDGNDYNSTVLMQTPFDEYEAQFSPEENLIAFTSDRSGSPEVYVARYPEVEPQIQISRQGGRLPRWSADGRRVYFTDGVSLMEVSVSSSPTLAAGEPQALFELETTYRGPWFDVSENGERFVVVKTVEVESTPVVRVVQNWHEEFREQQEAE